MIADAIRKLTQSHDEIYSVIGKVIAVDGDACDIQPIDGGAMIHDCKLWLAKGIRIIPQKDSLVVATFLSKTVAYCGLISEFESIEWNIGNRKLRFDANGLSVSNHSDSILKVMESVIESNNSILRLLKSNYFQMTPMGSTTSVLPSSIIAIELQLQQSQILLQSVRNLFR